LIAFVDRSDSYHLTFRRLFAKPPSLITTTLVVAEGHAWFLRRYDRIRALQFMAMVEDMTPLTIASVGPKEQATATALLRRFSDQDLTLTDAVGLHLMKAQRLRTCWSTDRHLGLTGVSLVINET
jgi:predicted nucleic acid-binding protein